MGGQHEREIPSADKRPLASLLLPERVGFCPEERLSSLVSVMPAQKEKEWWKLVLVRVCLTSGPRSRGGKLSPLAATARGGNEGETMRTLQPGPRRSPRKVWLISQPMKF